MEKFYLIIHLSIIIFALLIRAEDVKVAKPYGNDKTNSLLLRDIADIDVNNLENITISLSTIAHPTKAKNKLPKDCAEVINDGDCSSGVKTIYPFRCSKRPAKVYCDQTIDGGGWTVFLNRDASLTWEDFNRTYEDYVDGFGNKSGEFWLGLDNIRALTRSSSMKLRIDLEDYEGNKYFFNYPSFKIGDSFSKYKLDIRGIGESYENSLTAHHGQSFVTNELQKTPKDIRCDSSIIYRGPWWYETDGSNCPRSNLNGQHDDYNYRIHEKSLRSELYLPYKHGRYPYEYRDGIIWRPLRPIKRASMKIRTIGF